MMVRGQANACRIRELGCARNVGFDSVDLEHVCEPLCSVYVPVNEHCNVDVLVSHRARQVAELGNRTAADNRQLDFFGGAGVVTFQIHLSNSGETWPGHWC